MLQYTWAMPCVSAACMSWPGGLCSVLCEMRILSSPRMPAPLVHARITTSKLHLWKFSGGASDLVQGQPAQKAPRLSPDQLQRGAMCTHISGGCVPPQPCLPSPVSTSPALTIDDHCCREHHEECSMEACRHSRCRVCRPSTCLEGGTHLWVPMAAAGGLPAPTSAHSMGLQSVLTCSINS